MIAEKSPSPDRVGRGLARRLRHGRAAGQAYLGDDDPTIVAQAAQALEGIGPFAVGPMIEALSRARQPRLRAAIIAGLVTFGPRARLPVLGALNQVLVREKDPRVRAGAEMALKSVIAGRSTLSAVEGSEEAVPVPGGPVCPGSTGQGQDRPLPLRAATRRSVFDRESRMMQAGRRCRGFARPEP